MFFTANPKLNTKCDEIAWASSLSFEKIWTQTKKLSVQLEELHRRTFNTPSPYTEQMNGKINLEIKHSNL